MLRTESTCPCFRFFNGKSKDPRRVRAGWDHTAVGSGGGWEKVFCTPLVTVLELETLVAGKQSLAPLGLAAKQGNLHHGARTGGKGGKS